MSGRRSITTVLISLEIDEVERARESYLESVFSREERDYLSNRHIRSTAGWLALKKSLVKIINDNGEYGLYEKDIRLECLTDGRPVIADISISKIHGTPANLIENLFVSISHARCTAHGLAVLQEACLR